MVGRYEISDDGCAQMDDIVALPKTMGRPGGMAEKCSMVSSGCCALVPNGVIYPGDMVLGRQFMTDSASGAMTAPLKRYFLACYSNYVKMG